jgi:hypothetical protein
MGEISRCTHDAIKLETSLRGVFSTTRRVAAVSAPRPIRESLIQWELEHLRSSSDTEAIHSTKGPKGRLWCRRVSVPL